MIKKDKYMWYCDIWLCNVKKLDKKCNKIYINDKCIIIHKNRIKSFPSYLQ